MTMLAIEARIDRLRAQLAATGYRPKLRALGAWYETEYPSLWELAVEGARLEKAVDTGESRRTDLVAWRAANYAHLIIGFRDGGTLYVACRQAAILAEPIMAELARLTGVPAVPVMPDFPCISAVLQSHAGTTV